MKCDKCGFEMLLDNICRNTQCDLYNVETLYSN